MHLHVNDKLLIDTNLNMCITIQHTKLMEYRDTCLTIGTLTGLIPQGLRFSNIL